MKAFAEALCVALIFWALAWCTVHEHGDDLEKFKIEHGVKS